MHIVTFSMHIVALLPFPTLSPTHLKWPTEKIVLPLAARNAHRPMLVKAIPTMMNPPPADSVEHRDLPPHMGQPSSSHAEDPPHCTENTLQSSSVDPSALERILERQQQQLTTALATQQQTMMASFQQMFVNILASQATATAPTTAGNHNAYNYS